MQAKVQDLKQPRLRMSSLSSLANLSQNNVRHVGDLKQRRLQFVQYIYISHKQHSCTEMQSWQAVVTRF